MIADQRAGQGEEQVAVAPTLDAALQRQFRRPAEIMGIAEFQAGRALVGEAIFRNAPGARAQRIGHLRVVQRQAAAQGELRLAERGRKVAHILKNIRAPAGADLVIKG
ncbi:MAG TPA: hypothetical protein VLG73_07870 [Shinella sp.]|nr:hypothetical protein [Shinella sp.]